MPVPGPRAQRAPLPGYRNPGYEQPDRINLWDRPGPIVEPGRSPGTMRISLRGNVLGAGQIRRMYRQAVNFVNAQAPFSWTENKPAPGRPIGAPDGLDITVGLRYKATSLYAAGGTDNSRFAGLHTKIVPRHMSKPVTVPGGATRSRPTVRNRITSFGSRVPPLNPRVPAAQKQGGQ